VSDRELPAEFVAKLDEIERSCAGEEDPIRASGFGGGPERWRAEREPLLEAVYGDGDILDVGCANGYLLECLMQWGAERGLRLTPHGVDRSGALIERARRRHPSFADNFHLADAWKWKPPRRYRWVYAIYDCVPEDYLGAYVRRLLAEAVGDGGRLIMGAYGSRSRGLPPFDIGGFLESSGHPVAGRSHGGTPVITSFAWIDRQ
jgi:SAM-dependent methyltransferase